MTAKAEEEVVVDPAPAVAAPPEPKEEEEEEEEEEEQTTNHHGGYALTVDPDQEDKATQLKLCSFARPHMRAFHYSWWGFFVAFFIWFAIAPLLPLIRSDLDLSPQDIWTTNICAVAFDICRDLFLVHFVISMGHEF